MALRLHNTLTRTKEDFVPIDPSNVRMYVCGPTVYDFAHIGNARPLIVFDVLFRLLRHIYGPDHVTYVRNITDVDDKINARAAEEYPDLPLNEAIGRVTARTEAQFHEDAAALGCLPPTHEPRATDHIAEMRAMIETLIARGYAYVAEGNVLFHVAAMKDYGRLSNRTLDEMIAGARVEVAPYKRDPMDFVLWKPSKEGEPAWLSPAGINAAGRPGWHLECSAMSDKWLWQEAFATLSESGRAHPHEFDIHGGGIDLIFPHHENEIAQSRCAHGTAVMARTWLHNGFLQVEGEKMSKSAGNFVTIHKHFEGWAGYRWPGEALRFNMLRTHYRQPIDWTYQALDQAHGTLWDWYGELAGVDAGPLVPEPLLDALIDDLNTPAVLTALHGIRRSGDLPMLLSGLRFLGFSGTRDAIERVAFVDFGDASGIGLAVQEMVGGLAGAAKEHVINDFIELRANARKAKNFEAADRIRAELDAMGIALKDAKDPTTGELVTTWEVKR